MVAIQRIIGLILMALGLWGLERDARGQQSITLTAPPPSAVITVTAQAVAPFGASTVCYWVVANFPVGNSGPSQPGCAMNVGTTVNVSWTPVTGATGYDLLTTPTPSLPSGSASIALVTRFMSVTYQDTIPSSPFSYTVNTAPPASATFLLDNLNQSTPAVRLNVTNGLITGTSSFILGAAPIAASGANSITYTSIAANSCSTQSTFIGVPGSNVGDAVAVGSSPPLPAGLIATGTVTTSGTVTVSLCNVTSAAIVPGRIGFFASVTSRPSASPAVISQTLGTAVNTRPTGCYGWAFQVNPPQITITQLGRWIVSGNSASHLLVLSASNGQTVASCSLNSGTGNPGAFLYCPIANSVLTSSVNYFLFSQETLAGDSFYTDSSGTTVRTTSDLMLLGSATGTVSGGNCTSPMIVSPSPAANVPTDLQYHL